MHLLLLLTNKSYYHYYILVYMYRKIIKMKNYESSLAYSLANQSILVAHSQG